MKVTILLKVPKTKILILHYRKRIVHWWYWKVFYTNWKGSYERMVVFNINQIEKNWIPTEKDHTKCWWYFDWKSVLWKVFYTSWRDLGWAWWWLLVAGRNGSGAEVGKKVIIINIKTFNIKRGNILNVNHIVTLMCLRHIGPQTISRQTVWPKCSLFQWRHLPRTIVTIVTIAFTSVTIDYLDDHLVKE